MTLVWYAMAPSGTIADTQAQLDAARATVAAAPPGPHFSEVKTARVLADNLPTRLRRMNAQLEVLLRVGVG